MEKKDKEKSKIEELVRKAQKGDTEAFGSIYDYYVDSIYKYIFFKVDRDDALDLTENVFLKAWENLRSYRKVKNKYFSSWLYRIAHNIVVDHYRLKKETYSIDVNMADEKRMNNPVVLAEQKLSQETLKRAIGQLNRKYQQVIILKYVNGLENHEIAKVMRRSEGNLRILKFRALRALRQIMEKMNVRY